MSYKTDYISLRDLYSWVEKVVFSIPYIEIDRDPFGNEFVIVNTKTKDRWRIHRYELEDAKDPKEVVMYGITQMMQSSQRDDIRDIIEKDFKARIDTTMGAVGSTYNPSPVSAQRAHYDPTGLLSDGHSDEGKAWALKEKLFSFHEQVQITNIKRKIHDHIFNHLNPFSFNMKKVVIAGGCFASLINDEEIRDIDVFMLEDEANHLVVKNIIDMESRDPSKATVGNNEYRDNEKIVETISCHESKIQLITTKYKTREELIDHFDFKHCCISYDYSTNKLFLSREAFDLCKRKMLVANKNKKPALWRYEKFWKRGWKSELPLVS